MALTRSLLNGMGLTAEQIAAVIEAHTDTVNGLKEEIDKHKTKADEATNELKNLKEQGNEWQTKYEKEHSDFEAYKADQAKAATKNAVKDAYKALLKEAGVSEKRIDAIMKVTDTTEMKLDESGKLVDADKHAETIKNDWSEFITNKGQQGAGVDNPPPSGEGAKDLGSLSMEDYIAARKKK